MTSVTISRAELSLGDLAISGDGSGAYSLTQTGLGRPVRAVRSSFAEPSDHVEGQLLRQRVRDITALPLEVIVQGTSTADLEDKLEALDDALFQFRYTTTVTIDGVGRAWSSLATGFEVVGGPVTSAHWSQFFEVVSFTIPVQPTPEVI